MRTAWLSIDFEDIAHDFRREHGIDDDGPMREDALWRAYEAIETLLHEHLGGVRLTFFTTGILAVKFPAIVARINADGHEIACHYHFHDPARDDPPEVFAVQLDRAIDALQTASGARCLGFRAPRFSLTPKDAGHFRVLEARLAYDSSLGAAGWTELDDIRTALGLERLALFPVSRQRPAAGLPAVRPGGTYLKLFPVGVTLRALEMTAAAGLRPMIYLHPYEFVADRSFQVSMSDMRGIPAHRRAYWALRQAQWHTAGNRGVAAKLLRIAEDWTLGGPMRKLLKQSETA